MISIKKTPLLFWMTDGYAILQRFRLQKKEKKNKNPVLLVYVLQKSIQFCGAESYFRHIHLFTNLEVQISEVGFSPFNVLNVPQISRVSVEWAWFLECEISR